MINRFFPHGTGAGSGPIDYLLGKNRERENAQVLRGDPDLTESIINTAPGRHRYTSGVLSFAEHVDDDLAEQIMNEYERWFTADGAADLNFLWVKHTEHDRTELHFVIPNVELTTGRSLNPHIHKLDAVGIDALKDIINAKFDLADPNDPERKRLHRSAADYLKQSKNNKELIQAIDRHISERAAEVVARGGVWTRENTIQALEELGFEIARRTKTFISISHPDLKKNVRLKGGFYEPDCRINSQYSAEITRAAEEYRKRSAERAKQAAINYANALQKRAERIAKRYQRSGALSREIDAGAERDRANDDQSYGAHVDDFYGRDRTDTDVWHWHDAGADEALHQAAGAKRATFDEARAREKRVAGKESERDFRRSAERSELQLDGRRERGLPPTRSTPEVITVEWKGRKLGELLDYGSKVEAKGMSAKAAAYNIVKAGLEKGWKSIKFEGTDEFLRLAMRIALDRGIEVVARDDHQAEILKQIMEARRDDRIRKDAQRAIETAKRASEQVERASSGLERASRNLERASREFDQRVGRTAREELKMAYDVELERFKTEINLVDYMQSLGWTLNRKKSTKKTAVLKAPDGRKALVSISENGHYLWHDPVSGAGGSIIDFVQQERGLNLGRVRKELRPLLAGGISLSLSPKHTHLEKSSNNELEIERVRIQMTEQYARLRQLDDSYLRSRGIIISHDSRFANVRTDERGNTCFPHYDADGIVGWEKKNFKFTGYADGGKKVGIYATTNFNKAERVVVVESGIDAISHAQLFNTGDETAYVSMGGSLTKEQLKLLADKLKDREVVFALDNDEAGERFAQQIANVVGRDLSRSRPPKHAKDWNDVLIMEQELEKQLKRERAATRTRSSSFELGM